MENKLTIEHLKMYLGTGLKVTYEYFNPVQEYDVELLGFKDDRAIIFCKSMGITSAKMEDLKIYLHPLSSLTNEIEHQGQKFVPIERLLDIECGHNWSSSSHIISKEGKEEWWVQLKNTEKSSVFGFNKQFGFYHLNAEGNHKKVSNQFNLFQKLFEWNIDVFSLIPQGLAIEK